jgi:hypothetical protein
MEQFFEMIPVKDVEALLTNMGYSNLEFNGEEMHLDGAKFVLYIGEIDTTYEIKMEIVTPIQVKVKDRMVDEKHYCCHGKAIKLEEGWKITYG